MTDATEATVLASQGNTVHTFGAFVDYILEFAAGETEKTLSFTTEADNVNEGDGWLGVRIAPRARQPLQYRGRLWAGAGQGRRHTNREPDRAGRPHRLDAFCGRNDLGRADGRRVLFLL